MHHLDLVLQQISSDEAAVLNLPYILTSLLPLSSSAFSTPTTAQKLWIARINSLQERPKHPGSRWAGFCLAQRTAHLSRDILLTSADTWISFALPALSRDESLPTINAAVHLLATIYTTVLDMPEFHRRVVAPTVTKFSVTLLNLAEKPTSPVKLKALCMHTLTLLVHHHPNLHAGLQAKLHSLSLGHLSGSFPSTSSDSLVQSAADLHSVLHLTGGKVRGAAAWRKSLDGAIASALSALGEIASTIGQAHGTHGGTSGFEFPPYPTDNYHVSLAVAADRLRSLVALLTSLLRASTTRPVAFPVGALANLALRMISVDTDPLEAQSNGFVDPGRRAMEVALVPALWESGCELLTALSESVTRHITPYVSQYASIIAHRLDQTGDSLLRIAMIRALQSLLTHAHPYPITNTFLSTRLLKSLLPCLTRFLSQEPTAPSADAQEDARSTKAKKKAKMYEGDEVFRTTRDVLVRSAPEGDEILATLHLLPLLISSPHTNPATASVASRLLLSLLMHLQHLPASLVSSSDPSLRIRIIEQVIHACEVTVLYDASNPWLRRGLPVLAQAIGKFGGGEESLRALGLLIHPHLPPTIRGVSGGIEGFALYLAEGKEEREAREAIGLISLHDGPSEKAASMPMNTGARSMTPALGGATQSGEPQGVVDVSMGNVETPTQYPPLPPAPPTVPAPYALPSIFSGAGDSQQDANFAIIPPALTTGLPPPFTSQSLSKTASAPAPVLSSSGTDGFIPLGVTGGSEDDSDDDDGSIPEIDMRSDSESDEVE